MGLSKSAMRMHGSRVGERASSSFDENKNPSSEFRRTEPGSALPMPVTVATKPYDWTYTTAYAGHEGENVQTQSTFIPAEADNPAHAIPIAELTRPDPILFYAEIPLFEDELHDNGSSHLLVRIVRSTLR